jgi:ferritin-like metal-binding protein YciE
MSKKTKKLQDLFHDTLKDIYFAEKKILTTLPKMKKAAQSEELAAAFEKHHGETEGHVQRLEQVFKIIGEKPQAKTCDAILGIVDEGAEIMEEYKGSPALDAGLLAAAQAVEHYESEAKNQLQKRGDESSMNGYGSPTFSIIAGLEQLTLRAPVASTVLQVNITAGELASPSTPQALVLLGDLSGLRVRAEVDERDVSKIKIGGAVVEHGQSVPCSR